ncbi:Uu.00g046960.m01.CDS01 [Anthostomella pinea]|uniref:Uu.00g046960.m01.CDS01 n=1 Tax=Anthostomella pinea TaxID=933095 RepID=A0AAI8YEP2_9PEZI|nr:Uu.00g046960.m01.CDS01 [Anthostomella pinea]
MLPLGLLNAAQGHPMLVELKSGETLNGHLIQCDTWMNLTLKEVIQTSPEADKFVRLPEVYVKGNNIKYLRTNNTDSRAAATEDAVDSVETTAEEEATEVDAAAGAREEGVVEAERPASRIFRTNDRLFKPAALLQARKDNADASFAVSRMGTGQAQSTHAHAMIMTRSSNRKLDRIPTTTIYAALQELPQVEGTYHSIVKLVEYLVQERDQKPNVRLYECLIRANIDKNHGSAEVAGRLLQEMILYKIAATPQIYQALLEVTAVHPDYVLRSTVLFDMKNRWYSVTPNDQISIIVGLLRDGQYEVALAQLEEMNKNPSAIPLWLYDVFLYVFGDLGFHDEAFAILKHRQRIADILDSPLSLSALQFLLDAFSRDAFYPGIKYIWDRFVTPGYLNPSDAVTTNILNAASRHGDTALAIGTIQALSARGRKLDLHHYEALIHVHIQHGDLRKAFIIMCIMHKAGLSPDLSSTRSIFWMLRDSSAATDSALEILHELRLRYTVPSAAFNVILEATEIHRSFKVALDMYRSVRQICADGPDIETYNDILLRHCTYRKSMNFLVAEMEAFSIVPNKTTYDHLIRISTLQEDYETAFQYLEAMRARVIPGLPEGWWMSKDSALALIRRCILAEDFRVEDIIKQCRSRGMAIDGELQALVEKVQQPKQAKQSETGTAAGEQISSGQVVVGTLLEPQTPTVDVQSMSA